MGEGKREALQGPGFLRGKIQALSVPTSFWSIVQGKEGKGPSVLSPESRDAHTLRQGAPVPPPKPPHPPGSSPAPAPEAGRGEEGTPGGSWGVCVCVCVCVAGGEGRGYSFLCFLVDGKFSVSLFKSLSFFLTRPKTPWGGPDGTGHTLSFNNQRKDCETYPPLQVA